MLEMLFKEKENDEPKSLRLQIEQRKLEKAENPILRPMDTENASVSWIIGIVVAMLVASAVIVIIANNSAQAEDSADTDDKTDSLIDLWPFLVAAVPLIWVVNKL